MVGLNLGPLVSVNIPTGLGPTVSHPVPQVSDREGKVLVVLSAPIEHIPGVISGMERMTK